MRGGVRTCSLSARWGDVMSRGEGVEVGVLAVALEIVRRGGGVVSSSKRRRREGRRGRGSLQEVVVNEQRSWEEERKEGGELVSLGRGVGMRGGGAKASVVLTECRRVRVGHHRGSKMSGME
jgi:hypothetical protein